MSIFSLSSLLSNNESNDKLVIKNLVYKEKMLRFIPKKSD